MCQLMKVIHEDYKPYKRSPKQKLTNFAFNMMILVYLQSRDRPVLPNLLDKSLFDDYSSQVVKYEQQYEYRSPSDLPNLKCPNTKLLDGGTNVCRVYHTNLWLVPFDQAVYLHTSSKFDLWTSLGELFMDFIAFISDQEFLRTHSFDVPKGRFSSKDQVTYSPSDDDMCPWAHPYHIVDPFDRGHNPGK